MRISGKNTCKKRKYVYLFIFEHSNSWGGGEGPAAAAAAGIIIFLKCSLFVSFLRISIFLLPIYLDFQILGNLATDRH